jgi:hypothetical protein
MDSRIPVVVQMHVECAGCGHTEDETYKFDMPFSKSQPMEACESGERPKCGAPVLMPRAIDSHHPYRPPAGAEVCGLNFYTITPEIQSCRGPLAGGTDGSQPIA